MTFDEWLEKYKPVKNHIVSDRPFDDLMFETFGDEVDFVRAQKESRVWTWVDDGEHSSITNGFAFVNRQGYFIASIPYDEVEPFTDIDLEDDE